MTETITNPIDFLRHAWNAFTKGKPTRQHPGLVVLSEEFYAEYRDQLVCNVRECEGSYDGPKPPALIFKNSHVVPSSTLKDRQLAFVTWEYVSEICKWLR